MNPGWTRSDGIAAIPGLLGRRVSLRHRLPTPDGHPLFTDAVGELTAAGPAEVTVLTRRGPVRISLDAVVALREVPPAPPRRASWAAVARLEEICALAWPAPEQRPLGRWRLRAADGYTGRANSTLAVGDPGRPVPEALDAVRAFAAEHDILPLVQTPTGSPWWRAITAEGWVRHDAHPAGAQVAVLVGELDSAPTEVSADLRLGVQDRADWRLAAESPVTEAQRHVLSAPEVAHVGFGVARDGCDAVGVCRLAVVEQHLYVARLAVDPGYRGRGLATALMGTAARWGTERGARWWLLQVAEHNEPALALYRRLGLTVHHRYEYLRPPPG